MTTATEAIPNIEIPDIRVAKIATAASLSGLSQLEYHLGYLASSKDRIFVRLWRNSGAGKFNTDWLALADIEKALAKIPAEGTFTADAFAPLFQGRSVNSRYFTLACLLHARLLQRTEKGYVRNTPVELWQELQGMIQEGVDPVPLGMEKAVEPIAVPSTKPTKTTGKKSSKAAVVESSDA